MRSHQRVLNRKWHVATHAWRWEQSFRCRYAGRPHVGRWWLKQWNCMTSSRKMLALNNTGATSNYHKPTSSTLFPRYKPTQIGQWSHTFFQVLSTNSNSPLADLHLLEASWAKIKTNIPQSFNFSYIYILYSRWTVLCSSLMIYIYSNNQF